MSKIATALMFGCVIVLVSDAAFARARIRSVAPSPSKAATAQPAKPGALQSSKPGAQKPGAVAPQRPFAAAPRPGRSTFVNINARPFAAAPAAASTQRAMSEEGAGPLQYDPNLALTDGMAPGRAQDSVAAKYLAIEPAAASDPANDSAAANGTAAAPLSPQPAAIRMASPSAPIAGKRAAPAPVVCYVQRSGACLPF